VSDGIFYFLRTGAWPARALWALHQYLQPFNRWRGCGARRATLWRVARQPVSRSCLVICSVCPPSTLKRLIGRPAFASPCFQSARSNHPLRTTVLTLARAIGIGSLVCERINGRHFFRQTS
jgi:hypothetical protein